MRSIGMDVHRSFAQVAIFADGEVVENFRIDLEHDAVVAFGRGLRPDDEVVLEASRAEGDNLNVHAAALHVLGDLLGSVAAIAASLVIIWTGWTPIDPILSVLVVLLILRSAWAVVRESGHILLEGAPAGFDARAVAADLEATLPGVARTHHVHAWSITQERPMATLEVDLAPGAVADDVRRAVKDRVRDTTGMKHVTVEVAAGAAQEG